MRLGDLDALKSDLKQYFSDGVLDSVSAKIAFTMVLRKIDNAPTVFSCNACKNMGNERECVNCHDYSNYVHYEERPQGEWKHHEEYTNNRTFYITECPFCKLRVQEETNFCPNCGLPMKKGGME